MNVNLICVALSNEGDAFLDGKFRSAVERVESLIPSPESRTFERPFIRAYNSNRVSGTWTVSPYFENEDSLISFSQPPIPNKDEFTTANYWDVVSKVVSEGKFESLQPNYFGFEVGRDGAVKVWSDILGFGRCYYVLNDKFLAASNHIGALAEFVDGRLEVDEGAVAKFAGAGFFMNNDSPIAGVSRLAEAEVLEVDHDRRVKQYQYQQNSDLIQPVEGEIAYAAAVDQLAIVSHNITRMVDKTPSVFLSGGRDSRMTASIWLAQGNPANVITMGALPREAEIATELMEIFFDEKGSSAGVQHKITLPQPRDITMSLDDRLGTAFGLWDGDAAPANMKRNVTVPSGRAVVQIGGVGGEITHGYYYSRPGQIEKLAGLADSLDSAKRSFGINSLTPFASQQIDEAFEFARTKADSVGLSGPDRLDHLYLSEKFRRWGNQALGSTSAVLLSAPAFVNLAFNVPPEDKVSKRITVELVKRSIPAWAEVEAYKAAGDDSKRLMRQGTCTYQTDPAGFWERWDDSHRWQQFLNAEVLRNYCQLVQADEATPVHESWMNRAIWIDEIYRHVEQLNAERSEGA